MRRPSHPVRRLLGASIAATLLAVVTACGAEESGAPGTQPSPHLTARDTPAPTVTAAPTPAPAPSTAPRGTPSPDCPDTIASVRSRIERATWGKGPAHSPFRPVGVTICEYDALSTGQDYATRMAKRTGEAARDLHALLTAAPVAPAPPKVCTTDLGPTYVLRFVDNDRAVLGYAAEFFACHRLVAIAYEGRGTADLPAPRHVTPQIMDALR